MRRRSLLLVSTAAFLAGVPLLAQTAIPALVLSPDITTGIGALTTADEDTLQDDLTAHVSAGVGGLPAAADLVSYHRDASGARLLVFDTTVALPGGITATPRDVVRLDGATDSLLLAGAAAGIPDGVAIDAVTRALDGNLVLSFDVDVTLGGTTYADEDLVEWSGSSFNTFFVPSTAGIDPALDLDAADVMPNGRLLLSFDGSGSVNGIAFDDEDVLEVGQDGSNWHLAYDGNAHHPELEAADVDVVQYLAAVPALPFSDGFEGGNAGKWTWRLP